MLPRHIFNIRHLIDNPKSFSVLLLSVRLLTARVDGPDSGAAVARHVELWDHGHVLVTCVLENLAVVLGAVISATGSVGEGP